MRASVSSDRVTSSRASDDAIDVAIHAVRPTESAATATVAATKRARTLATIGGLAESVATPLDG